MPQVTQIQVRRDTTAEWARVDPKLAQGEIGFVTYGTDAGKLKIGNGIDTWSALPFVGGNAVPSSPISGQFGGTGVANTGRTITLSGNLAITGGGDVTLNATGSAAVTLPSGTSTLAKADGTNLAANSLTASSLSKYAAAPYLWYCPSNDLTCTNGGNIFGLTNGVLLEANTTYEFQFNWLGYVGATTITNASTLSATFPTGVVASLEGYSLFTANATDAGQAAAAVGYFALGPTTRNATFSVAVVGTSPGSGSKYVSINVRGSIIVGNTAGYFNPKLNFAGTGISTSFTTYAGSYMSLRPLDTTAATYQGTWN